MRPYQAAVAVFGITFVGIGIALVALTAARGGGAFGYVIGLLFAALGVGRLYLLSARRP